MKHYLLTLLVFTIACPTLIFFAFYFLLQALVGIDVYKKYNFKDPFEDKKQG